MSEFKVSHDAGTNVVTVHGEDFDSQTVGTFSYEGPAIGFNKTALDEVKRVMAENELRFTNLSLQISPAAYFQANEPVRELEEAVALETETVGNQVVPGRSSVENSTQVKPVETQTIQSRDVHQRADIEAPEDK